MLIYGPCASIEKSECTVCCSESKYSCDITDLKKRRLAHFPANHLNEADTSCIPISTEWDRNTQIKRTKGRDDVVYLSAGYDQENVSYEKKRKARTNLRKAFVAGVEGSAELASLGTERTNGVQNQYAEMVVSQIGVTASQSITPGVTLNDRIRLNPIEEKEQIEYTVLSHSDFSEKCALSTASTMCTEKVSPDKNVPKTANVNISYQGTLESTSAEPYSLQTKEHERKRKPLRLFKTLNAQQETIPLTFVAQIQNPNLIKVGSDQVNCCRNTTVHDPGVHDRTNLRDAQINIHQSPSKDDNFWTTCEKEGNQSMRSLHYDKDHEECEDILVDDGYLVTPGKHRIHLNSFLMSADQQMCEKLRPSQPGLAAMTCYAQDIYLEWRSMEQRIDQRIFQLSFKEESDIEKFRQMAVQCILLYARDGDLLTSTAHCSIHNVHRVLLHYVQQADTQLTANLFFGTVAACVRMALKHEETPEKTRLLRESPAKTLWKRVGLEENFLSIQSDYLTQIEIHCFKILQHPLTPPSGLDYIDRYLSVGGWPLSLHETYRDIAFYLVNLALFSRRSIDKLAGIPPSLISAASLALGIKVISAGKDDGYEFWPQRLVVYSGYTISDLRPAVRGLSALLRYKPPDSEVLQYFHPIWAKYDWK